MKPLPLVLLFVLMLAFIPVCNAATENVSSGRTVTCKGVTNITVSLGFENVVPMAQARVYYNWISVGLLVMVGAMASSRTTRFVAILVPIFAAMLVFFGWMTAANPKYPEQLWGVIVVTAVLAVAIYMKGSLHEKFGIAGPGSMFFNLVFYIILLQAVVGFVNYTQVWDGINAAPSENNQYTNIDLSAEITDINNTGGLLNEVQQMGNVILDATFGIIKMFIAMGFALCSFYLTMGIIFPWISATTEGAALLLLIQVGIYIIYFMAFMRFIYKPVGEGEF
jgi:hypothetical protein